MSEEIMNLPVIVQGALGSALFALVFYLVKKIFLYSNTYFAKFNNNAKIEALEFKHLQSKYMVAHGVDKTNYMLLIFYGAGDKFVTGITYICLGLLWESFFGAFHGIAYFIAIYYFFKTLGIIPLKISDGRSTEWHKLNIDRIEKELNELRSENK